MIRAHIDERGTTAAKLAWAIVEETGLLVEEIANIRRSDVDLTGLQLFVRKQKTTAARWVPFGGDTREYLLEWLVQRDPSVGHDRLLHRPDGRPYEGSSLRTAFSRAVMWEDAEVGVLVRLVSARPSSPLGRAADVAAPAPGRVGPAAQLLTACCQPATTQPALGPTTLPDTWHGGQPR